jgi:hypothetical protein
MDFLVARDDLHRCRFSEADPPQPQDGQALLSVEAFGLSANNITYATFGEAMSYWSFFPAEEGWGRVPVWGFAEVQDSRCDPLPAGTRLYGYLPPSTHLLVRPERVGEQGFVDVSPHRTALPPAYNAYARVDADPSLREGHKDEQMLLRPLFLTSFLLDDFLADGGLSSGAATIISSASSKTASALAFLLAQRERTAAEAPLVGLTSTRAAAFTSQLGVYDLVVTYDELHALPQGRACYVDIAGDAGVREAIHARYREELLHSAVVGATHHDRMEGSGGELPGPRPTLFFAPDWLAKRSEDWGRQGLEQRMAEAWRPYVQWTAGWLDVRHGRGPEALEAAYLALLDGAVEPATAHVLTLQA